MSRLEAVLATIGEQVDQADRQADRAERMAAESDRLRVVGRAPDQTVEVVVDGVGQLVDLVFTDRATGATLEALRVDILAAHAQAKRRLTGEIARLGEGIYGPGSASVAMMTDSYRDRFGQLDPEEEDR